MEHIISLINSVNKKKKTRPTWNISAAVEKLAEKKKQKTEDVLSLQYYSFFAFLRNSRASAQSFSRALRVAMVTQLNKRFNTSSEDEEGA